MKKPLMLLLLGFLCFSIFAQEPSKKEKIKFDYCELIGTAKFLSTKVNVEIDFGQKTKFFADNRYKDESGKPVVFNSMIDAMNFMGNQGWEFVQAYAVSASQGVAVYHYVLKKESIKTTE